MTRTYQSIMRSMLRSLTVCSITITAIDVVKTRIQIDPAYKGLSLLSGAQYVVKTEGPSGLLTGFGPTAVGYLVQVRRFHQMT